MPIYIAIYFYMHYNMACSKLVYFLNNMLIKDIIKYNKRIII